MLLIFPQRRIFAVVKLCCRPPIHITLRTRTMSSFKVHNTLKPGPPEPFVPIEKGKISWYACGPTVYDHSHLGHARNYVSTDIIRRILIHYFGYNVKFVMNFTDIDDKIILKSRRQKLLELEKAKSYTPEQTSELASKAFQAYAKSNLPALVPEGDEVTPENYPKRRDTIYEKVLGGGTLTGEGKPGDDEAKMKMHLSALSAAAVAIKENNVFGGADEILLPYVDSLYKETVDSKDHTILTNVTKFWENDFLEDMDALNVMRADVITRVTEYVPQIAEFVDAIVKKGFAYESEGSVYFDIAAFEKGGNTYAHLRPESRNDQSLLADGEGSLSKNLGGKRGAGDFALWKQSKAGEPSWPSPWGEGRPGWHIECSVMASDVLGSQMDMHSGGVDLAFPHHDNELAQSEAYYCKGEHPHTWVNYFLHMGHLSISGSKMSKSLKNFQTIKDALASSYTGRSMRVVFLMGRWNDGVEISPDMRGQAENWETTVNNFFTIVKSMIAQADPSDIQNLSISEEGGLLKALDQAETDVESALSDSFDTPLAMSIIYGLIRAANTYIVTHKASADIAGLERVARWVTKIVGIFGLDSNANAPYNGLGWAANASNGIKNPREAILPYIYVYKRVTSATGGLEVHSEVLDKLMQTNVNEEFSRLLTKGANEIETISMPYLRVTSKIRDELRRLAPTSPAKRDILIFCDQIRDQDLTDLGVYLDDRSDGQPSLIKFVPKEELLAQRQEKAAKACAEVARKEAAGLAKEKLEAEKREKAKLSPVDMFKNDERFSEWDDEGMPTKMKGGSEIPKSTAKKMRKDWERQKKLHEEYNKVL